ncbi:MAG: hypothetical protein LBR29_01005, partial [Methylobacteriaceae bacterium]|nr:hypothetical protein [Methylobacteriaceae bacterium]
MVEVSYRRFRRHCERSEAIQLSTKSTLVHPRPPSSTKSTGSLLDCFVPRNDAASAIPAFRLPSKPHA